jgi:hypothetical protein
MRFRFLNQRTSILTDYGGVSAIKKNQCDKVATLRVRRAWYRMQMRAAEQYRVPLLAERNYFLS